MQIKEAIEAYEAAALKEEELIASALEVREANKHLGVKIFTAFRSQVPGTEENVRLQVGGRQYEACSSGHLRAINVLPQVPEEMEVE